MTTDRLLLVEDDATTREVLGLLMAAEGWQVHEAESGEAALEALRSGSVDPQVLLCDLHLPNLQGAALAAALRPIARGACLLAMSASDASASDRAAYDGLLRKPFEASEVRLAWQRTQTERGSGLPGEAHVAATLADEADIPADLAVIAPGTLLKLEQQMGARAKELYAFALADAGDRLRRMEESLAQQDDAAFQKQAHALKGSAGMIGAERLAALASRSETLSTVSSEGSSGKTVQRMHLACNEIRLMLETLFPM